MINNDLKSIKYDYDFANPVMQELFPRGEYEHLESKPGYFWIEPKKSSSHASYSIDTSENKVTVKIQGGTISISFHSHIVSFVYKDNKISGPFSYSRELLEPGECCYYDVPKKVRMPVSINKYLFYYNGNRDSENISACLTELSDLKYLTQDRVKLIELTKFLYENLKQLGDSTSSAINIFFNWDKSPPLRSIYITWIALSMDQSFVRLRRKEYLSFTPAIFIPSFSVEITATYK